MIITVIRKSTGEEFKTKHNILERDFNKLLGYNGFDARKGQTFQADEEDFGRLRNALASEFEANQATEKQILYLTQLGVNIRGKRLTKSLASQLIDAVKSGQGVGHLGFTMRDGSN